MVSSVLISFQKLLKAVKPIPSDERNKDWQIELEDSEDFHDTSDFEDSDNFDENRSISNGHIDISDNIFLHYDANNVDTPKIDCAIHKLNKQFLRFRHLEKRLWKCKSSDFKLSSIKRKQGRRYVCSFCKFTAISWEKVQGYTRRYTYNQLQEKPDNSKHR